MSPIFLSYPGTAREVAKQLAQGLQDAGVQVWWDVEGIGWGENWVEKLQETIHTCSGYLILVGQAGVSRWVRAELNLALKRHFEAEHFPIFPLLLHGVEPDDVPPFLRMFQARRLAADVTLINYRELAQHLTRAEPAFYDVQTQAITEDANPFPGLEVFDERSARFFFGRQAETLDLLGLLGRTRDGVYRRWLQIDGPSGVGKSSLVRAGLIPAMRRGWVEEGEKRAYQDWLVAIMRPGSDPILNLAEALQKTFDSQQRPLRLHDLVQELRGHNASDPSGLRYILRERVPERHGFLLVIDQLEEIFSLRGDNALSQRDFDVLVANALMDKDGPLHLVTTIRSDFMLRFTELPALQKLLNEKAERYFLQPIGKDGLRSAVVVPARLAALTWSEKTLPGRIVDDAAEEKGALPLVAHLLHELWRRSQQRQDRTLSADDYDLLGGIGGALARSADALLDSLGPEERTRARHLLLALVKTGRGSEDVRRTITRRQALAAAGADDEAERILARLSGGHDPDAPVATRAPQRLIVVSSRHGAGINEADADVDLAHEALLSYDRNGEPHWRTLRCWIDTYRKQLEARDDLEAAAQAWQAAGQPEGGLPRDGLLEYFEGAEAHSELARAFIEQARALAKRRRQEEQDRAEQAMRSQRDKEQQRRRLQLLAGGVLVLIVVSLIILNQYREAKRAKNAAEQSQRVTQGARAELLAEKEPGMSMEALALGIQAVGRPLHEGRDIPPQALRGLSTALRAARRSLPIRGYSSSRTTGTQYDQLVWPMRGDAIASAAFSPDGTHIVTTSRDGTAHVWAAASGQRLATLEGYMRALRSATLSPDGQPAAFSPDGQRIVTASEDGTVRLWNADTGQPGLTLEGHPRALRSAAFSPNGTRIVTTSRDGTAHVWAAASGQRLATLEGHPRALRSAAFSPDGQRIVTASEDGTARLWEIAPDLAITTTKLQGHTGSLHSVTFSPDGLRILSVDKNGTVQIWDADSGQALTTLQGYTERVYNAVFSSNGKGILTTGDGSTARLWETETGQLVTTLEHLGPTRLAENGLSAAFSPDGQRILTASGGENGTAHVWDAQTFQQLTTFQIPWPENLVYMPNGQRILNKRSSGVQLVDATTGKMLVDIPISTRMVWSAGFSPNGEQIVTTDNNSIVALWSARSGKILGVLAGRFGPAGSAAFSRDGTRIVTARRYGHEIHLWDVRSRQLLATLEGHLDKIENAVFLPNGQRIVSVSANGTVKRWPASAKEFLQLACCRIYYQPEYEESAEVKDICARYLVSREY